jgi:hypothetical protein
MLDMALQLNPDFDDDLLQDMMEIIDFTSWLIKYIYLSQKIYPIFIKKDNS